MKIPLSPPPKNPRLFRAPMISGTAAAVLMLVVGIMMFAGMFTPRNTITPVTEHTSQAINDLSGNAVDQTEYSAAASATQTASSQYNGQYSQSSEISASEHRKTEASENTEPAEQKQTKSSSVHVSKPTQTQPQTETASVEVTGQALTQPQTESSEPCTVPATGSTGATSETVHAVTDPDGYFAGTLGFIYTNEPYKAPFRCMITSPDGRVFGGKMTLSDSGGIKTVLYDPLEHGEHLKSGNYTVCFYESDSRLIKKVRFTAVSNSGATFLFPVG